MKRSASLSFSRGYVSLILVITTGILLTSLLLYSYKHSLSSQSVQAEVQLNLDYGEKEDAILRSIVAITPNKAIQAMKSGSSTAATAETLSWKQIFTESLTAANSRKSISSDMLTRLNATSSFNANSGDSAATVDVANVFSAVSPDSGLVSSGMGRNFGTGYPVALNWSSSTASNDMTYPIISAYKKYGTYASNQVGLDVSNYSNLNILTYPKINFGYATPGQPFVAKRNWWAFNINLEKNDQALTSLPLTSRRFVFSIYEVPSQLAISSSAFMSLGKHGSGDVWQNVTIEGNVFAGKATLEGSLALSGLASRSGATIGTGSTVGGQSFTGNPMAAGTRESYQVTNGNFFPVSQASESGRVAFVPINRGTTFFDRFALTAESADTALSRNDSWDEFSTLTSERRSTWDNYSVGAVQCSMRLDITRVSSSTNATPTEMRFEYMSGNVMQSMIVPIGTNTVQSLPPGFVKVADENQSYNITSPVDVAYGAGNKFFIWRNKTGVINFNNTLFGDPNVGVFKSGYILGGSGSSAARFFAEVKSVSGLGSSDKVCVVIYPERIPSYLAAIGANKPRPDNYNDLANNSIAVNVDYTAGIGATYPTKPSIPCTDLDYGLVVDECANLSAFGKGFSIVTNLRMYIADDFNTTVATTQPPNYTGTYYPPCSLFAPEKRYGMTVDPFAVSLSGQVGSVSTDAVNAVHPLESKNRGGTAISTNKLTVNLKPITHPADIPPITMMNWLILLEEKSAQF